MWHIIKTTYIINWMYLKNGFLLILVTGGCMYLDLYCFTIFLWKRKELIIWKIIRDAFYCIQDDIFEFECIISSCRLLFSSSFTNSKVGFAKRQGNAVAHALTGEAMFLANPAIYFNIPNCIQSIIINEML
jgi:hypothetical protein